MAIAYLTRNDKIGVHNPGSVYGSTGTEKVLIQPGASNVKISSTVEELHFSLNVSQYAFKAGAGGAVEIWQGDTLLAALTVASGQELRFADGAVRPGVDANTGAIILGSMTLSSTPKAYSGSPDPSRPSDNAQSVTAGGIDDAFVLSDVADDAAFDVQLAGVDDAALSLGGDFGA